MPILTDSGGAQLTTNAGKVIVRNTGSILQVLQTSDATGNATTIYGNVGNGWIELGDIFSQSITLNSPSNKVLINCNIDTLTEHQMSYTIFRGETNLGHEVWGFVHANVGGQQIQITQHLNYLDSPGTLGPIRYNIRARYLDSGGTNRFGGLGRQSFILMEVVA